MANLALGGSGALHKCQPVDAPHIIHRTAIRLAAETQRMSPIPSQASS